MSDPKTVDVVIVGATGAVGEALLSVLAEREFPVGKLHAVAGAKSADDVVMFKERPVRVAAIDDFDFSKCRIAFFCAPKNVAKKHAPRAVKAGCWVIDVSSQFRLDPKVPLVVPEINAECLTSLAAPQIIASPAAAVIQAGLALFPLQQKFGLRRVDITTLLAVSTLGKSAVSELAGQTARLLNVQSVEQKLFPSQIAFNLLPAFDAPNESGYTHDELNGVQELKKLLKDARLEVTMSQACAPVFYGHTQIVRLEAANEVKVPEVRSALRSAGLALGDAPEELHSPVSIGTASDEVFVSRCAQRELAPREFELWTVADNIRKGAAINIAVIAEVLLEAGTLPKSHL